MKISFKIDNKTSSKNLNKNNHKLRINGNNFRKKIPK